MQHLRSRVTTVLVYRQQISYNSESNVSSFAHGRGVKHRSCLSCRTGFRLCGLADGTALLRVEVDPLRDMARQQDLLGSSDSLPEMVAPGYHTMVWTAIGGVNSWVYDWLKELTAGCMTGWRS